MDEDVEDRFAIALDTAARLLGSRLEPFLEVGPGEPSNSADFTGLPRCIRSGMPGRARRCSTCGLERSSR